MSVQTTSITYITVALKMNTKRLPIITCVPLLLRIEILLPMLLFQVPYSIILSGIWVVSNYYTEVKYFGASSFFRRFSVLAIGCIWNGAFLLIGWLISCTFVYNWKEGKHIDAPKIYAVVLLVIGIPLLIMIARTLVLLFDIFIISKKRLNCLKRDRQG